VVLLQPTTETAAPAWVDGYRGLWGLYSGDPLGGENGPTGPRLDRTGVDRKRWYDPVGWSGLDKTPPPAAAMATLEEQRQRLRERHDELSHEIEDLSARLMGLGMEAEAQRNTSSRQTSDEDLARQLRQTSEEVARLKAERAEIDAADAACVRYAERLAASDHGDPRAHLHSPELPMTPDDLWLSRIAAFWSAVSVGVLLLGLVALEQFFPHVLVPGAMLLLGIYAFIEALFHRSLESLIRGGTIALALIATLVIVIQFFVPLLLGLIVIIGVFVIVGNVRELIT